MNNAYIRAQQCKVKEAKFPFVKIGTQYWTTKNLSLSVTPKGNAIPEMQANGNVEKVVNGGFNTDTNWTKSANVTILSGVLVFNSPDSSFYHASQSINMTAGMRYKISITAVDYISGQYQLFFNSNIPTTVATPINSSGNGTQSVFYTAIGSEIELRIARVGGTTLKCSFDNVSIQEIGWSGSQELYDGIYAQTTGTVEQKTYAAVKAAAMWCNYNNDPILGGIYGKLYNWFAVKLFQMDIDYYNASNPDKKWANGFRMPTQAEFQTLSDYLGGNAVSGGHLKEAGLAHWNNPNTGADNSSGFSFINGGRRAATTGFYSSDTYVRMWCSDLYSGTEAKLAQLSSENASLFLYHTNNGDGHFLRLIKQ